MTQWQMFINQKLTDLEAGLWVKWLKEKCPRLLSIETCNHSKYILFYCSWLLYLHSLPFRVRLCVYHLIHKAAFIPSWPNWYYDLPPRLCPHSHCSFCTTGVSVSCTYSLSTSVCLFLDCETLGSRGLLVYYSNGLHDILCLLKLT